MSSALIGCFTVWLNVELCSDWLISVRLISVADSKKETQGGKYIFQYFLSQLYRLVIILYIKCGHQGAAINMRGIETASYSFTFAFEIHDRTYSIYTMERRYLPHILQDQMLVSGAQDL